MTAEEAPPLVSFGLPVYNGEAFVEGAMAALIAQDAERLEIVVSDNASTDGTWEVLQRFAGDPRVHLHRSDENLGAVANFNRVFHLSRGPFFAWAAADDRFDPSFASTCLDALADNPDAAGCLTGIRFVNDAGETNVVWNPGESPTSHDLRTRVRWYLGLRRWTESYGLFRRGILEANGLFPPAFGPDVLLVWRIILRHRLCVVGTPLLTYREQTAVTIQDQSASLVPEAAVQRAHFCNVGMWRALWAIAGELHPGTRWVARQELLACVRQKTWRRLVMEDLNVELHRYQAASDDREHNRPWVAKSRVAGIYVLMASIEPRVFLRAAARHALPKRKLRTP